VAKNSVDIGGNLKHEDVALTGLESFDGFLEFFRQFAKLARFIRCLLSCLCRFGEDIGYVEDV